MHMREIKSSDKYPIDAVRLMWNEILSNAEKLLDIDPLNPKYIDIILTIKKYYSMDDIEAYFKLVNENRSIFNLVGIN